MWESGLDKSSISLRARFSQSEEHLKYRGVGDEFFAQLKVTELMAI
jgi:hypothetical protein